MKTGDLIRNKNSESGELGLFVGMRTFTRVSVAIEDESAKREDLGDYECAEVYWPERKKIGTIQTNMIEEISDSF